MSTLREAAEKALEYMESRECHHESTHRGGVLWTICDDCGRKWADDEGGFVEYREPIPITDLRAALSAPAEQDGWQLVPVGLTEAMHVAGVRTIVHCTGNDDWPPRVWHAMLADAPRPAPAEPQPAAQQELKPQAATMCSCIECIGDQPEPTPEDLVQAAQQERKPLTDEWINRHSTVAIGCPLGSKVILVSSLRRLLGITATKGDRHD